MESGGSKTEDPPRLNYSQLAKAAGLGVGQVQKYMTGKYHNDNPREPIERALGMR